MISKNGLGWIVRVTAMATLSLGTMAACGDDGAGGVDACIGHTCVEAEALTLPEGGIARIDHMKLPDGVGGYITQAGGYMVAYSGQADIRPMLGAPIAEIPGCFNLTGHNGFLNGYTDANQTYADSRTYYDVGIDPVTLTSSAGGSLDLAMATDARDPSDNIQHGIVYAGGGDVDTNAKYSLPVLPPAGDYAGMDPNSGFDVPGQVNNTEPPGIYVPGNWTLTSHNDAAFFGGGLTNHDPASPLTLTWTQDEPAGAGWPTALHFAIFATFNIADPANSPPPTFEYVCVTPATGGTLTVPPELFAKPGMPPAGLLITGEITHVVWANNGTRFDFMGVNGQAGPFSLAAP